MPFFGLFEILIEARAIDSNPLRIFALKFFEDYLFLAENEKWKRENAELIAIQIGYPDSKGNGAISVIHRQEQTRSPALFPITNKASNTAIPDSNKPICSSQEAVLGSAEEHPSIASQELTENKNINLHAPAEGRVSYVENATYVRMNSNFTPPTATKPKAVTNNISQSPTASGRKLTVYKNIHSPPEEDECGYVNAAKLMSYRTAVSSTLPRSHHISRPVPLPRAINMS